MAKEYKKRDSKGDKPEFKKADKRKENYKGSKKARSKAGEKLSKGEELEKTTSDEWNKSLESNPPFTKSKMIMMINHVMTLTI